MKKRIGRIRAILYWRSGTVRGVLGMLSLAALIIPGFINRITGYLPVAVLAAGITGVIFSMAFNVISIRNIPYRLRWDDFRNAEYLDETPEFIELWMLPARRIDFFSEDYFDLLASGVSARDSVKWLQMKYKLIHMPVYPQNAISVINFVNMSEFASAGVSVDQFYTLWNSNIQTLNGMLSITAEGVDLELVRSLTN